MAGHKSLNRILHRCLEECDATMKIASVTSWKDSLTTFQAKFDIQVMNKNGFKEPERVKNRLIKKHDIMIQYFEKTFGDFLDNYDYNRIIPEDNSNLQDCIWVCWWQGYDAAPDLVKECINSIKRNAGNHKVIIIDDSNYRDYVIIPEWVEKKREKGIITRTNFSDLLRLSLLSQHGGMWLDATFFCAKNELEDYFKYPLWSIKRPDYLHCSVASGYFAGYSLKCDSEYRWIFTTIRDFFLHYWETNDSLIDYLLVDYMIVLAQRKDVRIAKAFQEIIPNNDCCDDLYKVLDEPYKEEIWEKLTQNTALFKLTWKQNFEEQKNGIDTFYGKFLKGELR